MMINVNIEDRKPLQIGGIEVGYIHNYIYLDSDVCGDGKTASVISKHVKNPSLTISNCYKQNLYVQERYRLAFTRF